jgi:hypothetical protein
MQVQLMLGEFSSSRKEGEAVLSCRELMAQGASAAAVHATLLCELTSMYKDEVRFIEARNTWLQVMHLPASLLLAHKRHLSLLTCPLCSVHSMLERARPSTPCHDKSSAKANSMTVQMLEKPLEGSCGRHLLLELVTMLPELFDENIKAVTLIGTCLGDMIQCKQVSPSEVCCCFCLLSCA